MEVMKSNAFIINTARGGIVNESDLEIALRDKIIAGAAMDVFETEPYYGSLAKYENCNLTSHMGSMTEDCRTRMEIEATEEAVRFILNSEQKQAVPEFEYDIRIENNNE
jgi:D-3-phosphoglycerate dehydrogenase